MNAIKVSDEKKTFEKYQMTVKSRLGQPFVVVTNYVNDCRFVSL